MQKDSNKPTPDVILRSSDGALFYSWKIILSICSPLFSDMFALPQPDTETSNDVDVHDGRPVVDLAEDSRTLEYTLSLCHPAGYTGKQFKIESIQELRAVLEAATKYDMENLCTVALEELSNPALLRQDPVRVYALACQYQCHKAARLAAKHTLALPMLLNGYIPELEKIHAGNLCRLFLYREKCMEVAHSVAKDHTWIEYNSCTSPLFGCSSGTAHQSMELTTVRHRPSLKYRRGREEVMSVHTWWCDYMRKSGCALQRSPHGNAVRDEELVNDARTEISSSTCNECKSLQVWEAFRSLVDNFAEEVDRRVAEVEINLEF